MATIYHLNRSITQMTRDEVASLVTRSRANRRLRPTKKIRAAKANARSKRKATAPVNPFEAIKSLTPSQKAALAKVLLGDKS